MGQDLAWIETLYAQVATLPGQNVKVADTVRAPIKTVGSNLLHSDFFSKTDSMGYCKRCGDLNTSAKCRKCGGPVMCTYVSPPPKKKNLSHFTAL